METDLIKPASFGDAMEVISFIVADEEYCLDISGILEIRGWTPTTPVAQAPDYLCGVICLRGVVMPVIDLGRRLGLAPMIPQDRNVIIVSQTRSGPVGLLVEAVCETLIVQTSKIKPAEDAAGGLAPEFVKGFLPTDRRMITVLDLAELLPQRRYVVECEASLAT